MKPMSHSRRFRSSLRNLILMFILCTVILIAQQSAHVLFVAANSGDKVALAGLKKLANDGDADAQYLLALLYGHSNSVVTKDYAESGRWLTKSALQGIALAQLLLGTMYADGRGVARDYSEAVRWYAKAALQDNADAQFNLGWMYYNGQGLTKDYVEAMRWYTKAALQDNADAQSNLGAMYSRGEGGVIRDMVTAYMWRNLAAAKGDEIAKTARDALEKSMTPAQIAEAQKLSREWKPKQK